MATAFAGASFAVHDLTIKDLRALEVALARLSSAHLDLEAAPSLAQVQIVRAQPALPPCSHFTVVAPDARRVDVHQLTLRAQPALPPCSHFTVVAPDARRVDVHQLTWHQVDEEARKTGMPVQIALSADLRKALEATPRNHVTVINTEFGKPFTVNGFSVFMRDAIRAAGLPLDCKPHGLRKTLGRLLADANVSDPGELESGCPES
jgi:hypothetical protein